MIQALLTESLVLGLVSALVALLVGGASVRAAIVLLPEALPRVQQIGLDGAVLAFTAILTLVTTVLFGLAPLLASGSVDLEAMLRQGSGRLTAGRRQHRVQQAMVVINKVGAQIMRLEGESGNQSPLEETTKEPNETTTVAQVPTTLTSTK